MARAVKGFTVTSTRRIQSGATLDRRTLWIGGLSILALPSWAIGQESDVATRVKKIIVDHLGVEPEKVTESARCVDDLGADSLDTVELVMAFEEEFGCEILDDAAQSILTVGDAIKFLKTCKQAAGQRPKKTR
jgi:acyl carrier protein